MIRSVEWRPRATKDLEKLERPLRERIVGAIERLVESGEGVRRLVGTDPPEFPARGRLARSVQKRLDGQHDRDRPSATLGQGLSVMS